MTQASTASRRAILAGIIGAPALAASGALATTNRVWPGTSFADVVATWRKRRDENETYTAKVHNPAHAAYEADCARIPHATVRKTIKGTVRTFSTGSRVDVSIARAIAKHPGDMSGLNSPEMCELNAALDKREQARAGLSAKHRIAEINATSDRLNELDVDAWIEVKNYPVSNVAELHEKVFILAEHEYLELADSIETVLADLSRLAGRA